MKSGRAVALTLLATLLACGSAGRFAARPELLKVRIIRSIPHDPEAYTQGLLIHRGKIYESTGLYGLSTVRRMDLRSGRIEAQTALEMVFFGEGLARVGTRLYQLTWQEGVLFVWDLDTLQMIQEHVYQGEGWGLCFDGKHLVMSDGSERLTFRDPASFTVVRDICVSDGGKPVELLNELECVGGMIYANVWGDDRIARIDAATGQLTAWIDASGLFTPEKGKEEAVLNGIAHLPGTNRFLITGKLWPRLFEVEFVPAK